MRTDVSDASASPSDSIVSERLVEQYNDLMIRRLAGFVTRLSLGIMEEDCSTSALAVVIHCMENMELFDETQRENILSIINNISYA